MLKLSSLNTLSAEFYITAIIFLLQGQSRKFDIVILRIWFSSHYKASFKETVEFDLFIQEN